MKQHFTPEDLAVHVYQKLKESKKDLISEHQCIELFQTLFYTSLKTEESQYIKVTICVIDPNKQENITSGILHNNSWRLIRFKTQIPYSVKNLVKLSKAADPWSSALAIYPDKFGEIQIWGMIDQQIHFQSYLNYESNKKPQQPGIFQASITGIGNLVVIFEFQLLAILKQNSIVKNFVNVFNYGQLSSKLKVFSESRTNRTLTDLTKLFPNKSMELYKNKTNNIINSTLSRILLAIQNYKHGGAVLITPNIDGNLQVKYEINYDRLSEAIDNYNKFNIELDIYSDINIDNLTIQSNENNENMSILADDYLNEGLSKINEEIAKNELKGAIRFVSSLSCIDGLVVLSTDLIVRGFGAIIKSKLLPKVVYSSKTAKINKLTEVDLTIFGTRHQSMVAYCYAVADSIGFVVSQDGDIRAIMNVDSKVIIWENIKVQQYFKSDGVKKLIAKKIS